MADNYYEWLELSVENFEGDPAKLSAILEKKITEWNSSKSMTLQNRAAIHQTDMRTAIKDAGLWKNIYNEYKANVDNKIAESLEMCAENMKVLPENYTAIAKNQKVSVEYVKAIAMKKGIDDIPTPPKPFTLKDLEPNVKIKSQLDSIQKSINELGYSTLAELIGHETNTETDLYTITKDSALSALKEIKSRWSKVSPSNKEKYQQKSHIDRICSGFMSFLKTYDIKDYISYLNWKSVNDILYAIRDQLNSLSLSAVNDKTFNSTIDSIYSVIGDRDKSKSILMAFCDEKGVSYPKPLPNIAVCPFCANGFEKKNPMQNSCPSCGKSFVVKCPKCGKSKNMLVEGSCDGIDLLQYPLLDNQVKETQSLLDSLDFVMIRSRITQIQKKWPDFPGTGDLISRCQAAESTYGNDILKLRKLCDENKYYEAKTICDRIGATYPKFKMSYKWVYDTIAKAEQMFKSVSGIQDNDKKIELLLEIMEIVSDYSEIKVELGKFKIEKIDSIETQINVNSKTAVINWKSQNKPNSVQYYLIKKKGSAVSNASDGEVLTITQCTSYSDTGLEEGKAYFYAVYAKRGPQESPVCVTNDATIYLKKPDVVINPKDSGISLSWNVSEIEYKVFYSEKPISKFGDGTSCSNVTSTGVDIEGLKNGQKYYISVYKVLSYMGKQFVSSGVLSNITPMELIEPPAITKAIGKAEGEFIITHTNPKNGNNFELYFSPVQAQITANSTVALSEVHRVLRKIPMTPLGNDQYSINMNGSTEMYIYAVISRSDSATIGNFICLRYAKGIAVTNSVISGNKLLISIDNWVSGADALLLCYNDDSFPEDKDDCDRRITISKLEYERTRLLEIQSVENKKYYITIFARKSGEYIPVCNHCFDNSISNKIIINYYFKSTIFGGFIVFESNAISLPEISICYNDGCLPLTKNNGTIVGTIPFGTNGQKGYKLPKIKTNNRTFAKLFTDDSNYQLVLSRGDGRLN